MGLSYKILSLAGSLNRDATADATSTATADVTVDSTAAKKTWIFKLRFHCQESLEDHRHRSSSTAGKSRHRQWHRDLKTQLCAGSTGK